MRIGVGTEHNIGLFSKAKLRQRLSLHGAIVRGEGALVDPTSSPPTPLQIGGLGEEIVVVARPIDQ